MGSEFPLGAGDATSPTPVPLGTIGHHDDIHGTPPWEVGVKPLLTWGGYTSEKLFDLIYTWFTVVSEYTHLNLTSEKDRLPALSGLASGFARPWLGRYLAGMWEAALPECLLFDVSSEMTKKAHDRIRGYHRAVNGTHMAMVVDFARQWWLCHIQLHLPAIVRRFRQAPPF